MDWNCKNIPITTLFHVIAKYSNKNNNKNGKVCGHKDSALYEATVLFALTFSLEDSFRKYKIDHRSYSLCHGIEFILCSEYLFPECNAPDLLNSRSTLAPTFHFRIQEAQNSILSSNSSHPQFPFICITCYYDFSTES